MSKDIRIAIVDKDKCNPKSCNYLCKRLCPGVRMGEDTIVIDEKNRLPIINEELCTGCGICANRCPQNAIKIIKIGIDLDKPIHQYDKNSFRLFSLPEIEKGYITGLIGRNGIGKTTALNILSGNIIPNLGKYNEKADIDKIINFYRGKSIQKHFEDLKHNKIDVAYKIQKVKDIPKIFDNKIIELLKTVNKNEKELTTIIKELELEKLVDKKPKEISGGELQRVAIAATLLKKSNLYFLDEYSTFLDIRQRFRIAKYLNKIINKDNSILLIEHDLAILDYLSDFIQIMYGTKNAYGACSSRKTTKKGINAFLEGFLKEENLRIRNYEINFVNSVDKSNTGKQELLKYPKLTKKLGDFELVVEEGKINCGEIIGILGPNAIGKTTFIKLLAGNIKADNNNKITKDIKISYKPQYIDFKEEITIRELFSSKDIDLDIFNSEFKKQLDLEKIFDQKIKEISGGELQKVAIAYFLSKDADIYLIDEPSAFLDVELRLVVSNAIKNIINKKGKSAFIVDHDLLFLDYISDKILLFEGTPSINGRVNKIVNIEKAFNKFLKTQNITFRQDPQTKRPRANKENSQKDKEQKKNNKYYYTI